MPSSHGKFHEKKNKTKKKTEIKGIIGIRNFWTTDVESCENESKKGGKDQESIQLSTTWESDKNTIKHRKPAGGHMAAMNRREIMTKTRLK